MKNRVLILCTGNSCRSQMAEGFLKSFDKNLEVYSAGTNPSSQIHPKAVKVMDEIGIDIGIYIPENVNKYTDQSFDYVITVCGNAKEICPVFTGNVMERIHIGFEDPAEATGTEEAILNEFRQIRDQIKDRFFKFYSEVLKN